MRHRIVRAAVSLTLFLSGGFTAAQQPSEADVTSAAGIQAAGGYSLDAGFNDGAFFLDRFAGPNSANYRGRKIARLSNGDVVVVGLVPAYNQPDPPEGQFHVGLVRYNAAGRRVAWTFPSPYGNFGNQYLIYPGGNTSGQLTPRFTAIKDVKTIGDRIYVMADHTPDGESRDVQMLIFSDAAGEGGRFVGHYDLFTSPFNEDGAEMIVFGNNIVGAAPYRMIAVGTVYGGSGNYIQVVRYDIGGANNFQFDTTFGTSNIFLRQDRGGCSTSVATAGACPIIARSVASGFRGFFGDTGPIYIGADRQYTDLPSGRNDWDAAVIKLSNSGQLQTDFGSGTGASGGGGFAFVQFDLGTREDRNRGIAVRTTGFGTPTLPYRDEIYAVVSVAQACASGTGIGKLDQDGHYIPSFGGFLGNGKLLFGGWNDPNDAQACAVYGPAAPFAIARNGTTLAIAGQDDAEVGPDFVPSAAVFLVDADSGSLLQRFASPIEPPWATFTSSSALYGIVANGDGSFSVTGDARDSSTGHTLMFATARVSRDRIFADGFD